MLSPALVSLAVSAASPGGSATAVASAARSTHRAVAASGCAFAGTPANHASVKQLRAAVLCLVNSERRARGLPALRTAARLDHSAQGWSNEMVAHGEFSHGSDFSGRITASGFRWSAAGENIATGFPTARQVVDGWMKSTGHCENILNPTYRDVGTGVNPRPVRGYASGPATWTEDFALPMGQTPPSSNWRPAHRCPH